MTQPISSVSPVIVPPSTSLDQSAKHRFRVLRTHVKTLAFAVTRPTFQISHATVPDSSTSLEIFAKHKFHAPTILAKTVEFAQIPSIF
jgi:hypothetical protein